MGGIGEPASVMTVDDLRRLVLDAPDITSFQKKVYLATLDIPTGTVVTYGELARRIGCASARAVGHALARNPFAPLVPCHRVVRSDGTLGGYKGADDVDATAQKTALLLKEGYDIPPQHR